MSNDGTRDEDLSDIDIEQLLHDLLDQIGNTAMEIVRLETLAPAGSDRLIRLDRIYRMVTHLQTSVVREIQTTRKGSEKQ